jgi:hypothetical protein
VLRNIEDIHNKLSARKIRKIDTTQDKIHQKLKKLSPRLMPNPPTYGTFFLRILSKSLQRIKSAGTLLTSTRIQLLCVSQGQPSLATRQLSPHYDLPSPGEFVKIPLHEDDDLLTLFNHLNAFQSKHQRYDNFWSLFQTFLFELCTDPLQHHLPDPQEILNLPRFNIPSGNLNSAIVHPLNWAPELGQPPYSDVRRPCRLASHLILFKSLATLPTFRSSKKQEHCGNSNKAVSHCQTRTAI